MSAELGGTVESEGFTVTSTHESSEEMTAVLAEPTETTTEGEPDPSKAASVLGKRSGEAAAEKRKAEGKNAKAGEAGSLDRVAEDGEGAEPVRSDGSKSTDRPLGKPDKDPRARMLEATRKEAEAKREAETARREREEARSEAARYRAELEAARSGRQEERPQPRSTGDAPKEEDFETYAEFIRATARHEYQQEQRKASQAHEEFEAARQTHEYKKRFSDSMAKARQSDPEFFGRMSPEVMDITPSRFLSRNDPRLMDGRTWIADELFDNTEHAPALMSYLSEHPEEFQRIATLPNPRVVTREMARLVTRLEPAPQAPDSKPSVSKARPPVRPVTGSPYTAGEPDPDASSFDEHLAFYNAKARKR